MRWQLLVATLSQPAMSEDAARERQRLFSSLWRLTQEPEERELEMERARKLLEEATGIPFVRKAKVEDRDAS